MDFIGNVAGILVVLGVIFITLATAETAWDAATKWLQTKFNL